MNIQTEFLFVFFPFVILCQHTHKNGKYSRAGLFITFLQFLLLPLSSSSSPSSSPSSATSERRGTDKKRKQPKKRRKKKTTAIDTFKYFQDSFGFFFLVNPLLMKTIHPLQLGDFIHFPDINKTSTFSVGFHFQIIDQIICIRWGWGEIYSSHKPSFRFNTADILVSTNQTNRK